MEMRPLNFDDIRPVDVYLQGQLLSHDERFHTSTSKQYIQELCRLEPDEYRSYLYNIIPEGGKLDTYPSCGCGYWRYASRLGEACPKCNSIVTQTTDVKLENLLWLQKPFGISRLMNIKVFIDLYYSFKAQRTSFDPIEFLIDPNYRPGKLKAWEQVVHKNLEMWVSDGVVREWSYFADNVRTLIPNLRDLMIKHNPNWTKKESVRREINDMIHVLETTEDNVVYAEQLPILNKYLLTIEKTDVLFYKSKETGLYGEAITDAVQLPCEVNPHQQTWTSLTKGARRHANRTIARMYINLAEAYFTTMQVEGKKGGLFRGDMFGQRDAMTFRGVITPITDAHDPDEIRPPWFVMVTCLKPLIAVKLAAAPYNMSPRRILEYIDEHVRVHSDIIEKVLDEIVADFGPMGIPCSLIRYPSLYKHSNNLPFVRKFKTDPMDRTISVPAACLPGMNGDFDGDELTAMFILVRYVAEGMMPMHISHGLLDLNQPFEYGKAASLPTPTVQVWAGYLSNYPDE